MNNMRYVFDLDNTLCITEKNQDNNWDYLNAKPILDRIELVNELFDNGNYIIIETARGCTSKKNWYEQTYKQLMDFGLKFNELRTGVKFNGDLFIDDKGVNSEVFFEKKHQNQFQLLDNQKIVVFSEIFVETNELRLEEYVYCINKNISNKIVEKIFLICNETTYKNNSEYFYTLIQHKLKNSHKINLVLESSSRFTFNNFIEYTKKLVPTDKVVVVCNLDIFIPETENWFKIKQDFFEKVNTDVCLALSRTEYINEILQFKDEKAWERGEFADAWCFKTPLKITEEDFPFVIPVGSAPTCDNFMFLILKKKYQQVFNWADKYVIYHHDFVRKPESVVNKEGRMILHDDVVLLDHKILKNYDESEYCISPYQDWQKTLFKLKYKMEKGALEDKFLLEEFNNFIWKYGINRIVETGTYLGWSTKILCGYGVPVDSVEINTEFYNYTVKNLNYDNLRLHNTNSIEFLKSLEIKENDKFLFFIDSHWDPEPLPLLDELEMISQKGLKPVIIIHDFFVPDENNLPKFGYDKYGEQTLCLDFIAEKLKKIYGSFEYHYNKEVDSVNSGVIFIYPIEIIDDHD